MSDDKSQNVSSSNAKCAHLKQFTEMSPVCLRSGESARKKRKRVTLNLRVARTRVTAKCNLAKQRRLIWPFQNCLLHFKKRCNMGEEDDD